MNLEPLSLFLVLLGGFCWTLVYLDGIRLGTRDHTYAIPFWALALNFAWELLNAVLGFQHSGLSLQVGIVFVWALFDLGILYTYFRYGGKWFPKSLRPGWFVVWSLVGLVTALIVQYAFIAELGLMVGRAYAAFLQNLLMSILFIGMLVQRGSSEGQSQTIAVNKWLGTLGQTILFGIVGGEGLAGPNAFILVIGLLCCVFDLIYIAMLARVRVRERSGDLTGPVF